MRPLGGDVMRSADFQIALGVRPCAKTEHFALHHVSAGKRSLKPKLSTGVEPIVAELVDDRRRLGLVVPKRMARRAVTRNLVKRHGRAEFRQAEHNLPGGDWLLRLRKAWSREQFNSASSWALRQMLSAELAGLFSAAVDRQRDSDRSVAASVRHSTGSV